MTAHEVAKDSLIINWNMIFLRDGILRVARSHPEELGVA
jgi:hypothetical protein